jgi:hypothetical protein
VETVMLSLHVVGAIALIGPMTVAVNLFPRHARAARGIGGPTHETAARSAAVASVLHGISRAYAVLGLSVPVAGLALAGRMGVVGDGWVVASLVITVGAAAILAAVVLPDQHRAMAALITEHPPGRPASTRLSGLRASAPAGFAVLWVIVVVLMVARPGATTGI